MGMIQPWTMTKVTATTEDILSGDAQMGVAGPGQYRVTAVAAAAVAGTISIHDGAGGLAVNSQAILQSAATVTFPGVDKAAQKAYVVNSYDADRIQIDVVCGGIEEVVVVVQKVLSFPAGQLLAAYPPGLVTKWVGLQLTADNSDILSGVTELMNGGPGIYEMWAATTVGDSTISINDGSGIVLGPTPMPLKAAITTYPGIDIHRDKSWLFRCVSGRRPVIALVDGTNAETAIIVEKRS